MSSIHNEHQCEQRDAQPLFSLLFLGIWKLSRGVSSIVFGYGTDQLNLKSVGPVFSVSVLVLVLESDASFRTLWIRHLGSGLTELIAKLQKNNHS